ncbi:MAG: DUF885 domain-containing protein [Fulvivirga sp.]|uniref:DUF885 domain-containing protein n=1 Tax=Fulvivirga sp. TaxID=1931237 RepID=UPI0032F008E4
MTFEKANRKRIWKFWLGRSILALLFIGIVWVVNLIWFKPFNVRHFYDKIFLEFVINDPETITQIGIPVLSDMYKDELTDVSDDKNQKEFKRLKENYATLLSYDFDSQSSENQLNTKILSWFLGKQVEGEPYFYYDYPVNQMFGVQSNLPSMMESSHKLNDESDVEAYIARLSQFDTKFDQVIDNLKIREEKGIIPPKFVIDKVLNEMRGFTGQAVSDEIEIEITNDDPIERNILFSNFETKIDKIEGLSDSQKEEYKTQVRDEIRTTVFNAYGKLISYFEELDTKSSNKAGVWKFPNGDAYYQYQLEQNTTTNYTPEQVHQIGLSEVARIKKEMWDILNSQGYGDTTKTVGEIIQALNKEDRFLFQNNDEGRKEVIARYNEILDDISNNLDEAFDVRPKAPLEVKRIPEFKEEGSPGAYYEQPPMDKSRGGIFYANLRDVTETVKFGMKTLAYHEGIPGHHFQIAIQGELENVPIFRTFGLFTAFVEGWALYSEQLAWELGFYENDPFGNLGRLQGEMFRAVRLVVDTGIHYKKWTREEAIDYMVANTGMTTTEVTTEIERYIVMPGQACAYKIGMMKILELREKAKTELGDKFDLKEFHNVVLKNGAVPLDILEELIDEYIAISIG